MDGAPFLLTRVLKRQACEAQIPSFGRDALKLSLNEETTIATLHDRYKDDIPELLRKVVDYTPESLIALYDVALKAERQRSIFCEYQAKDVQKEVETKSKILDEREKRLVALEDRISSQESHIIDNAALRKRVEYLEMELIQVARKNISYNERLVKQASLISAEYGDRVKRARETHLEQVNVIEEKIKMVLQNVELSDEKLLTLMDLFDDMRTSAALWLM